MEVLLWPKGSIDPRGWAAREARAAKWDDAADQEAAGTDGSRPRLQLAEETVTATVGGGAIKVTMTGDQHCKAIVIDPECSKTPTRRCCRIWSFRASTWPSTSRASSGRRPDGSAGRRAAVLKGSGTLIITALRKGPMASLPAPIQNLINASRAPARRGTQDGFAAGLLPAARAR